ncbi:MAG: mechanosensitive ion channel [Deltaproteobacteria bacterium]|nr:mechanosensitive ion channel [Deltaproteobacteria bacterium]
MRLIPEPFRTIKIVSLTVLAVAALAAVCLAQEASPSPAAHSSAEQITAERNALAGALEEARRALQAAAPENSDGLRRQMAQLQQLDLLYAQELDLLKQQQELAAARDQMHDALRQMNSAGINEPRPYSILLLDGAQDELESIEDQVEAIEATVRAAEEALQQARDLAAERERQRRAAREAFETNHDPVSSAPLETALQLAQLDSRVAQEQARVRELELANEKVGRDAQQARVAVLRAKVELIARDACLKKDELDKQLAEIDKDDTELRRSLSASKRELETADRRFMAAQQRAERQENAPAVAAEVEARRRAREALQLEVSGFGQRLQKLVEQRQLWQRRYQVSEEAPTRAQLSQWEQESQQALQQLTREERIQRTRLAQLRQSAKALGDSIVEQAQTEPEVAKWLIEQQESLQEQSATYEALLTGLETVRHLHDKLLRQIARRNASINWRERVGLVWDRLRAGWSFEITAIEDRPITVGKIVVGFILLAGGFIVARRLSRWLGRRLFPRLGLDVHAAAALQSISFYVLLSLLTLFALNVINVPLTIFTFVGGALAIGVGFGSQNIVNNFISGLILLAERPIKVGDLIEVDGTKGTVERIGPRSTRILGEGNIDILVPNSHFLERNVINWTLKNDLLRTHVEVGVAYGTAVDRVTQLLRQSVAGHEHILDHPAPEVVFANFGDNALQFEVHFWIHVRTPMQKRLLESDVRYRIERLFAENGISIAFPQRDVHLDTTTPLSVRVVKE